MANLKLTDVEEDLRRPVTVLARDIDLDIKRAS
jgi:hypothetical protein